VEDGKTETDREREEAVAAAALGGAAFSTGTVTRCLKCRLRFPSRGATAARGRRSDIQSLQEQLELQGIYYSLPARHNSSEHRCVAGRRVPRLNIEKG